ncbi:MAG: 39S ribosomal protein L45, partial [Desulfovibrio sp.]|nr:39S ribosomal protein L45 [Desulfovibrio sp.]
KAGVSDHKGSSDEEEPFLPAVRRVSEQGGLSDGVLLAMGEKKHASATGHTGADNEAFSVFPLHTALEGSLLGAIVFGFPYHELGVPDLAILALIGFLLVWRFTPGPKKTKEQKDIPCNAENRPPSMQLPRKRPHDDLRDAARENAHIPRERESGLPDRKTPQADKADTPLSRHADRQLTGPTDEFGHPPPGHEPENGWDRGHQRSAQGWAKRPGTDGESAVTWPSAHAEAAKKSMSGILPERFELEDFLEGARVFYTRMQEAWAARSTESLAPFMTPEMVRLIRERAATGFQPSSVHIMLLNAELLDLEQREDKDQAKVEFSGLMCVNDGAPTELREVWSFARERNKDGMWRLADMEEREDRQ